MFIITIYIRAVQSSNRLQKAGKNGGEEHIRDRESEHDNARRAELKRLVSGGGCGWSHSQRLLCDVEMLSNKWSIKLVVGGHKVLAGSDDNVA